MGDLAACVGWDWADQEHEVCMRAEGSEQVEREQVRGTPEALHAWARKIEQRFGGKSVGVCIETSRAAVIWALSSYAHIVLYPVNPKSAASFREAFYPSGKKDDPVDADVLMVMLDKHRDKIRPLKPADADTRVLGMLSEYRRKLVGDLVRNTNRLRDVLKSYYPQGLELAGELDTPLACDLIERWPSLEKVRRARASTLRTFYVQHRSRSKELMERRLEIARTAVALTNDPAMIESGIIQATGLVRVVRALLESIAEVEQQIGDRYQAHSEHDLIDSFPGAGPAIGPRLIALLSSDRERFGSHEELQRMTGVAPVTSSSGGRNGTISVHRRLKRSKFLHQTIVEWAGHSLQSSQWAREYYATKVAAGMSRFMILRSLGYKWLRILYRCWKTRVLYNEQAHQDELIRRRSPLAGRLLPAA